MSSPHALEGAGEMVQGAGWFTAHMVSGSELPLTPTAAPGDPMPSSDLTHRLTSIRTHTDIKLKCKNIHFRVRILLKGSHIYTTDYFVQ